MNNLVRGAAKALGFMSSRIKTAPSKALTWERDGGPVLHLWSPLICFIFEHAKQHRVYIYCGVPLVVFYRDRFIRTRASRWRRQAPHNRGKHINHGRVLCVVAMCVCVCVCVRVCVWRLWDGISLCISLSVSVCLCVRVWIHRGAFYVLTCTCLVDVIYIVNPRVEDAILTLFQMFL